jgi:hypothetical protein
MISNTICLQQCLYQMILVMGMVMDDIKAATLTLDGANTNVNEPYSHQHKRNNRITGTGHLFGKWKGNII